jgi:DNA repair protein SbcD/Mre11
MAAIRILLLADSHLGFDLPERPRSPRRRRGHDFLANYAAALAPALAGEVDVVVHGGDVFHRPRVSPSLAWQALEPLARVADRGVPVFVVPGNHERGRLPHERFASHPHVHVFDAPRTFEIEVRGERLAVSGFPSERDVRSGFGRLLERTGWRAADAPLRLLCMHQCFEGATVGPGDFVFRSASDVVRAAEVPAAFKAVLSGHIHRHQVLIRDMHGRPVPAPVFYPGSIERTSMAEMDEEKGYLVLRLDGRDAAPAWEFRRLPARPMLARDLEAGNLGAEALRRALRDLLDEAPADAILRIRVRGEAHRVDWRALSAAQIRRLAPPTMNVEIQADAVRARFARPRRSAARAAPDELRLDL